MSSASSAVPAARKYFELHSRFFGVFFSVATTEAVAASAAAAAAAALVMVTSMNLPKKN
jgi:hypothetical protein